jgi:hypothetical protein
LSVTAKTMAIWAFLPVVMNCLTPLSTKASPSRTAVVGWPRRPSRCAARSGRSSQHSPLARRFSHSPSAHRCRTSW